MKLRYQLRGLGIGMVFMALLWALDKPSQDGLSDAEIMERARELGMVESGARVLSELASPQKEETVSEETVPEETMPEETVPEGTPQEETVSEETVPEEQEPDEAAQEKPEVVSFTIKSGSGSESVSRNLAAAGLVADAKAYDKYLCDNGYSKSIRVGTFEIPMGSSEEEIAKIITGKR